MGEASRPLLLPQNRKLRHLQGIYVRNLTLSRPRGRTIDDGELNKTPQKLEALRASGRLHHAHSSGDLRPPKLRRRSSNWVGATPDFRQKKLLKSSVRRRAELKASIKSRSDAIKSGNEVQAKVLEDINNAQDKLSDCRSLLTTATADIHGQRRRICEELLNIFPIEPTTQPLLFTICGLPLPNSSFEDADEDVVSAALGYVARLVDMLQYYLAIPLPYPIAPYGSRSIIHDLISILSDNQRT